MTGKMNEQEQWRDRTMSHGMEMDNTNAHKQDPTCLGCLGILVWDLLKLTIAATLILVIGLPLMIISASFWASVYYTGRPPAFMEQTEITIRDARSANSGESSR